MAGRGATAAVPARLKLIEGRSPGRDSGGRPVKPTPSFVRLPPEPPDWLSPVARAEWDRVLPELQRLQLTKPLDAAALTAYCLCWARLVEAQRLIDAEGVLGTSAQGRHRHPAVAVVEAAAKELRTWCQEFGLTPSAESRLTAPEAQGGDRNPFAEGPG